MQSGSQSPLLGFYILNIRNLYLNTFYVHSLKGIHSSKRKIGTVTIIGSFFSSKYKKLNRILGYSIIIVLWFSPACFVIYLFNN